MEDMKLLADEIRQLIIETVSMTGGHLSSSLGVVELTIALHYVFNTPSEKLVWDVGHQTYAHKIITGRKELFKNLRQYGGASGFPKRSESEYDTFGTGHSSTSISAAMGMAQAGVLKGDKNKVIAIIGDGSLMAGMAFEGLNNAGHLKKDLIVILNDNEMSISSNVGALSSSLSGIISGQAYNRFRKEVKTVLEKIPGIGQSVRDIIRKSEGFFKGLFMPGLIFHELGFTYIGPVQGHDIEHLVKNLENIRKLEGPVFFHVVTKKGKGYAPAEKDPTYFHSVGAFDIKSGKSCDKNRSKTYTEVFGNALTMIAEENLRILAITAGMTGGTGLEKFAERFPDRFFDVGIAEQHAVTFAAGLAAEGFRPVVAIYSTFLQRAFDQILHDVCIQNLPVIFMIDRAGIVGEDGFTHHGLFDISYLRSLPNLIFMSPKDENELQHMLYTALQINQPVAIRYPRGSGKGVQLDDQFKNMTIGQAEIIKDGYDAAIFSIGSTVYPALEAAEKLELEGINCSVINSRFIKPVDKKILGKFVHSDCVIFTVEENVQKGGFGSAVLETIAQYNETKKVWCIGIPDIFVEHGSQEILRKKYGIDSMGIFRTVMQVLRSK
ncbi:MAG: 1-deoxy-D-xylulose-5-phosphate synthase [Candidatus Schekmanbacteria bacterium RBG_13_48_7]|uniref:1-deoxy-D-xylulose-5-phosphate synthase n=1 Tax=Candidatus Schekmanbacteria bacterium RBG_13_48_7 TaxID=1817878 RepID=A0A1F7RKI1_9BACT|nr:MAG: 1-deoxy-D-xylulose-5-phosphate synthase [Candidatus Schekmanbacteria bacterium RBG_13_48_7]